MKCDGRCLNQKLNLTPIAHDQPCASTSSGTGRSTVAAGNSASVDELGVTRSVSIVELLAGVGNLFCSYIRNLAPFKAADCSFLPFCEGM